MPVFPDPNYADNQFYWAPVDVGLTYYQLMSEGLLSPGDEAIWYFWGINTFTPAPLSPSDPTIYPVPRTFKNFFVFPVWPNASVRLVSVAIDVPSDAPQTLRYAVAIANDGPGVAGYRLLAVSQTLTLDGEPAADPND